MRVALAVALIGMILAASVLAAVPQVIPYQGRLTTPGGSPVTDGAYQIVFTIYDNTTSVWTSGTQSVQVTGGLFSVLLGDSPMTAFPQDLSTHTGPLYLGIKVGSDPEIAPRTKLVASPYALQSLRSDTAANVNKGIYIGDSMLMANQNGITIGTHYYPSPSWLMYLARTYNTTTQHTGVRMDLANAGSASLWGIWASVDHTGPAFSGEATAIRGDASSDGTIRHALYGRAQPQTNGLRTGSTYGVFGVALSGLTAYGIYGLASGAATDWAGYFSGNVNVTGTLTKGAGAFRIDHPLDPENKYLQHSFVESPDMKNIYDGVVTLDASGSAVVTLPEWFSALNGDFRYQLTCIGGYAPVYVGTEISDNQFTIAGGSGGLRVSWQITGIRKDAYANANRIQVELDKKPDERGKYLYPAVYGQPEAQGIDYESNKSAYEKAPEASTAH